MIFGQFFKKKDVYLASYPRSGNTWMRVLMAYLYFDQPQVDSLVDLQKYIPDEHFNHQQIDETYKIQDQFRIIKTHSVNNKKQYKKIVYLYRNPVDVAWSFYNFLKDTQQLSTNSTEVYVDDFIAGKVPFGSWENHVKSWMPHTDKLVVSYEEFAKDTFNTVLKINGFIGLPVPDDKIKNAITTVTPSLVKKITDDEIFYGSHKPNFVSTPLEQGNEEKKQFYSLYSNRIKEGIQIYDFVNKKLLM